MQLTAAKELAASKRVTTGAALGDQSMMMARLVAWSVPATVHVHSATQEIPYMFPDRPPRAGLSHVLPSRLTATMPGTLPKAIP
jgi:hypothetical protein